MYTNVTHSACTCEETVHATVNMHVQREVSWSLIYAADVFERTSQLMASAQNGSLSPASVMPFLLGPEALAAPPTCHALVPHVCSAMQQVS